MRLTKNLTLVKPEILEKIFPKPGVDCRLPAGLPGPAGWAITLPDHNTEPG